MCAACVAQIPAEVIGRTVASFQAVEHRLEFVAAVHGVDYYNDSKATNVDATAKAIASFPGDIHLILGGKDKNSDYSQLSALLRARVKAVYTIGSAAAKIESHLRGVVSHSIVRDAGPRCVRRPAPPLAPEKWCCWRRPAPASISSKIMSIGDAYSKQASKRFRRVGRYGKTRRRR